MKIILVTNIPAPYRVPVLNKVAQVLGDDFLVLFCARIEPNRKWDLEPFLFNHIYLKESFRTSNASYIHNNFDVIAHLRRFQPDVVITTGFNPTFLYAWCYALLPGVCHIPMTDGWMVSERDLGPMHRIVRHLVFRTSRAFIGASKKSLELYRNYGRADADLFQSHLCIDNERFSLLADLSTRCYDVMFSGQIIARKMPGFFADVVCKVKEMRGSLRALVIGDGALRESMLARLADAGIEVDYAGFLPQSELPSHYSRAKLFLFTTSNDPWGIIANEALASGTPVITTPYAGAAHDLIIDGWNGHVLEADVDLWAGKINELLGDSSLREEMGANAINSVAEFTFDNAARGIIAASQWAFFRSDRCRSKAATLESSNHDG